jgi:hypothetical protein
VFEGSIGIPGTGSVPGDGSERSNERPAWSSCIERPSGRSMAIIGERYSTVDRSTDPPATTRRPTGLNTRSRRASNTLRWARPPPLTASAAVPPRCRIRPVCALVVRFSGNDTSGRLPGSTAVSVSAAAASESTPAVCSHRPGLP